MFYKISITNLKLKSELPEWINPDNYDEYSLVEADSIRTARNLAIDAIISVNKATELELVQAGRENWPIIRAPSETTTDDGQMGLPILLGESPPDPHAEDAPRMMDDCVRTLQQTPPTPHWLPQNPVVQDTGG